ncbi:MAG: hypothetical protein IT562_11135 [Alphaproteobacteria bacterium]|nr:hypothetical protein [Alphaproteobacteria bacterium]
MRCFFHVVSGSHRIAELEGAEFAHPAAAIHLLAQIRSAASKANAACGEIKRQLAMLP